jgi:hypothetical protein
MWLKTPEPQPENKRGIILLQKVEVGHESF